MSRSRTWFKYVVWFGILANWSFAAFVLFVDPARLLERLHLGPVNNTIWIVNYSVLLALLSCFYIPAASDPLRYRANAWLLIAARLIPASTFFVGVAMGFMPRGFLRLGAGDGLVGLLELFLLTRLLGEQGSIAGEVGEGAAEVTYA
jgi:hypothetical protein